MRCPLLLPLTPMCIYEDNTRKAVRLKKLYSKAFVGKIKLVKTIKSTF
jgi:hypothetical protein